MIPGREPFSLLFADPPYRISKAEVRAAIEALREAGLIAGEAVLVWEHASHEDVDLPDGFLDVGTKRYGSTEVTVARYEPVEEA